MNKNEFNKIVLILIILLGAYFRLSYIELTKFGGDQGNQFLITKNALETGHIIKAGNESHTGLRHGAIAQYLLSIPMMFSRAPEISIWFLSLLSLITIYMVFRIGNDFFSSRIGLIASGLFATSHVSVAFARLINNEPLSLLSSSFFMFAILKIIKYKSSFYSFILPILSVILILTYNSNLILLIFLIIIFLLVYRHSIKIKYFLSGCLIAAIIYLPYLTYLFKNGFLNLGLLYRLIWSLSYLSETNHKILNFHGPVQLLKIFAYHYPGQKGNILDWVMAILFLLGILILIYKLALKYILLKEKPYLRIKQFPNEFIILIWLLLPLVTFLFIKNVHCLYYSAQLPFIFILISLAICTIINRFSKVFIGNTIVFIIILSQIGQNINNLQTLVKKGDKDLLRDQKKMVEYIIHDSKGQPFILSQSQDYLGHLPANWLYLFMLNKVDYKQTNLIPKGVIHYIVSIDGYPPELPEKRFGVLTIYKQEIKEEIKQAWLEDWRYSIKEDPGWEKKEFEDAHWTKTTLPLNINRSSSVYIRATLNIPEGKKYDRIDIKTNGYILELYIDGKRRNLLSSRFILTEKGDWQPLIKNLGEVKYELKSINPESLSSGRHTIAIKILTPKNNLYLDIKKEPLDITLFNFSEDLFNQ